MTGNKAPIAVRLIVALVVPLGLLAGCSFAALGGGENSVVSLAIGMKQPAAPVTSVALVVTGPGMAPIARSISPADSETTLEVPAGRGRTFRVLVNTVSVTFQGESTVDLEAGRAALVTLQPELSSTQIVIPDCYNYRIVQIADSTGTGWIARAWDQLGFGNDFEFQPIDIDFDAEGRIYVANQYFSAGIVRLLDINATSHEVIVDANYADALAIDRANNLLYFTNRNDNDVFQVDLDGLGPPYTPVALIMSNELGVSTFRSIGLAVDDSGFVYMANAGDYEVLKYDPNAGGGFRVVRSYAANLGFPWEGFDVMVKEPYVYLADTDATDGYLIQKLDKNLGFLEAFGSLKDPPAVPKEFWGPRRFLAILNKKIYLIDEGYSSASFNVENRLVSFGDMAGAGWETYGRLGPGVGEFDFPFYGLC